MVLPGGHQEGNIPLRAKMTFYFSFLPPSVRSTTGGYVFTPGVYLLTLEGVPPAQGGYPPPR